MNNNLIILELFLSAGEYIVLNDFHCIMDFHKNELLNIRFVKPAGYSSARISDFYLNIYLKTGFQLVYWECPFHTNDYEDDIINHLLPNIKKLSPEELIIKDIIT
jgi:hypothetical protein